MPVPSPRNKILPARGNFTDLSTNVASLLDGEICYAIDQDQYYQNEGGTLVSVGATKAQGILADSAIQPGDNVSELTNDAGYITSAQAPGTDLSYTASTRVITSSTGSDATLPEVVASGDSGLITGADKAKLDGIESGATADQTDAEIKTAYENNVNTNAFTDSEQSKLAGIAAGAEVNTVDSVAGKTGDVTLVKADVGLGNVDNTSDADKPISTATQTALDSKADLVGGFVPTSQIPAIAITEFLGSVGSEAAMLALTGQPGDWCLRTDKAVGYVIVGADPSVIAGWEAFTVPGSAVTSINTQVGDVVLGAADVGAATTAQGALADSAVQRAGDTMTGALILPSGTAGAPALGVGSTDNGIYSPGTDQVAISTNGTGRLFINANGSVTAPQGTVTLGTSGAANAIINSADGVFLNIDSDNTTTGEVFVVGKDRTGASGGTELFRITEAGLVGIGTSSPESRLHSTKASSSFTPVATFSSQAGTAKLRIDDVSNSASTTRLFITHNFYRDGSGFIADTASIGVAAIKFDNGSIALSTDAAGDAYPADRLFIDSSGRVGIGTTSPGTPLQVVGTIYGTTNIGIRTSSPASNIHCNQDDSDGSQIQFTNTTTGATASDGMSVGIDSSEQGIINVKENKPLIVSTNNTEAARIDSSGRLLVGTSSSSSNNSVVIQGYSGSTTGQGILTLAKGSSTPADGNVLGAVEFTDSGHVASASVIGRRDGGTWTSGSSQPTRLVFSTTADGASSPTERMRLSNSGALLIATQSTNVSSNEKLTVNGISTFYRASGTAVYFKRTGNDGDVTAFFRDTTAVGSISVTTTATAYNTSSDYRLKENVTPVTDGITRLQQLKPSRFNFIADPTKTVDGFIAHEAAAVVPEAVTGEKDAVGDEGNPVYQGIDQSKLVPLLTAALQEAIGRIETLEAEVAALKAS